MADRVALVAGVEEHLGGLDVLVNNAGMADPKPIEQESLEDFMQMIEVNLVSAWHLTKLVGVGMVERRSGSVINIASIGAYTVSPTAAVYCATKFAVAAITEGLRQEVGADIRVTLVSPGVVESELAESISDPLARDTMRDFRKVAIKPEAIARAIGFAIDQPADVDVSEMIVRPTASPY